MNKVSSIKTNNRTNLTNQAKFRFNEISTTENYFKQEIKKKKLNSKKLRKHAAACDCIDKTLIVLSATSRWRSTISFTTVIGAPKGIKSAFVTLILSLTTGIIKKLLSITRKKKKKHDKIVVLAKSYLKWLVWLIWNWFSRTNVFIIW